MPSREIGRGSAATFLVAVCLTAGVAGCGGDEETSTVAVTTSSTTTPSATASADEADAGGTSPSDGDHTGDRHGVDRDGGGAGNRLTQSQVEARQELAKETRDLRQELFEAIRDAGAGANDDPRVQDLRDELQEIREESGVVSSSPDANHEGESEDEPEHGDNGRRGPGAEGN